MLRDGQALGRDEEQAVTVLPLLHLVARADPSAKLGLGLWVRIEVARAQGPSDQLDVACETFHDGLGHRHVRVGVRPGFLGVLLRIRPHLLDVCLGLLAGRAHDPPWASVSSTFAGLNPASRVSPMTITGSEVMPISISSWRAAGSLPTFFSTNATPFCDRYSVARLQGP